MSGTSGIARPSSVLAHATCVLCGQRGAALLRGPSGSGKSDLALRLIDGGAALVADDQVVLTRRGAALWAAAPTALAGRIEVRGVGILAMAWVRAAPVAAVFDLVPAGAVARLPEREAVAVAGVMLPRFDLAPLEASAPAKVRAALDLVAARAAGVAPAIDSLARDGSR
jgi:serine kinase of HPr protein (carbohydrate metabolism regulator)